MLLFTNPNTPVFGGVDPADNVNYNTHYISSLPIYNPPLDPFCIRRVMQNGPIRIGPNYIIPRMQNGSKVGLYIGYLPIYTPTLDLFCIAM
jgi:hypothetical protein